jgi:hypothetical protein
VHICVHGAIFDFVSVSHLEVATFSRLQEPRANRRSCGGRSLMMPEKAGRTTQTIMMITARLGSRTVTVEGLLYIPDLQPREHHATVFCRAFGAFMASDLRDKSVLQQNERAYASPMNQLRANSLAEAFPSALERCVDDDEKVHVGW